MAEYALCGLDNPMGISAYRLGGAKPLDLPSLAAIEDELSGALASQAPEAPGDASFYGVPPAGGLKFVSAE